LRWWLRSRRAGALGAAIVVQLLLVLMLGGELLPTPGLLQERSARVPATVFIPLLLNSAVHFSLEGADPRLERTGVRRAWLLDLALVVIACLVVSSVSAALGVVGSDHSLAAARNAVAYIGLGLVLSALTDTRVGAGAPAVLVLVLALFSPEAGDGETPWNWPLADGESVRAAAWAIGLCAAGMAALGLRSSAGAAAVTSRPRMSFPSIPPGRPRRG
jgi:hypothetical protein